MRNNQPITNREKSIPPRAILVSKTDLKGLIVYASKDFSEASEFEISAMVDEPHNLVRHPDMPQAAFVDLWQRIKNGRPWRGLVKNRAKSGDHYWVDAQVSPQFKNGQLVGFMSVRRQPARTQIEEAERLYAALNAQGKNAKIDTRNGLHRFLDSFSLSARFGALLVGVILLAILPLLFSLLEIPSRYCTAVLIVVSAMILPILIWTRGVVLKQVKLANVVLKEMGEGNFTHPIDIRDDSELGSVLESIQIMHTNISGLIFQMTENGLEMNAGAKTLAESSQSLSAAIEQIAQQSSIISSTSTQVSENLQTVSSAVEEMSCAINEVAREAAESARVSSEAAGIVTHSQNQIRELNASAENIGRVIEIIGKISEKIDLLALNASIEAAGAGEAGRAFTVVASEIKELARQTAASSIDIRKQIQSIQSSTREAITSIGSITEIIKKMNEGSVSIASSVEQQSMTTKEIAASVSQISTASTEINQNISGISLGVTESAKDAHRISDLSIQLKALSDTVATLVGEFKVQK